MILSVQRVTSTTARVTFDQVVDHTLADPTQLTIHGVAGVTAIADPTIAEAIRITRTGWAILVGDTWVASPTFYPGCPGGTDTI